MPSADCPPVDLSPTLPVGDWLGALLRGGTPPWPLGPDFTGALFALAREERSLPLLLDILLSRGASLGVPAEVQDQLRVRFRQQTALELRRQECTRELVASLADGGLRFLLFKGTPLAYTLYPQACLRDRGDTDLLFDSRASAEAAASRLQALGFERMPAVAGDLLSYQFPCIRRCGSFTEMVDLHWATSNDVDLRPLDFDELEAGAIAVPALGPGARSPGHAHALVLACLHRLAHVREGEANRAIWLYDIHLLMNALTDSEWEEFLQCIGPKGLGRICVDGVLQAKDRFATPTCETRLADLQSIAQLPGQIMNVHHSVLSRDLAQLRSRHGRERFRLFCQYFFPSPEYMAARYRVQRRWQLPYFYLKRILSGSRARVAAHLDRSS